MLAALLRYPKRQRRRKAQDWNALGQKVRRSNRLAFGERFEETIKRAKIDRKGSVFRFGKSFKNGKEISWEIRYSIRRSDQFDVFLNGVLWKTGGKRKLRQSGCPIKI